MPGEGKRERERERFMLYSYILLCHCAATDACAQSPMISGPESKPVDQNVTKAQDLPLVSATFGSGLSPHVTFVQGVSMLVRMLLCTFLEEVLRFESPLYTDTISYSKHLVFAFLSLVCCMQPLLGFVCVISAHDTS